MKFNKHSIISVIIPLNATEREKFASDELRHFLTEIFGCTTVIVDDTQDVSGDRLILGAPSRNKQAALLMCADQFNAAVPGPEGMMIKDFGEHTILLAGSDGDAESEYERGTVYAVYELLERYMGASLAAYVNPDIAGGNEIPHIDELTLESIEYIKQKADLPYRTAIVQYGDAQGDPNHKLNVPFLDWLVRNRYNRILTWGGVYDGYKKNGMLEEAIKRGLRFTVGHHAASKMFLPPDGNEYFPEHYYQTHPEYYKLTSDGTRFKSDGFFGQWIFCSRNESLINEVSDNIIEWIYKNPAVDIIAFWPQDGRDDDCVCEECSKYSKVTNYTYFLNSVAKKVSAVHPHVKIDMLAYVDLWECPEGLELEPCLMVEEATWHHTGLRKAGSSDGSGVVGTFFESDLLRWHEVGAEVAYYDYYMGVYPARNRLIPMADELQPMFRRNVEKGIMGSGTQIECYNMWNHLFNFYCFGRTAYDTDLGITENLERFCKIFGKGAPYMSEYIKTVEEFMEGQTDIQRAGYYLMKNIDKEPLYELMEKALEASETPCHRNNVRMMRMALRYSDVECDEVGKNKVNVYMALRPYIDETGELYYMSKFDSFKHNDPGYGITIPVDCPESEKFVPDKWYKFE